MYALGSPGLNTTPPPNGIPPFPAPIPGPPPARTTGTNPRKTRAREDDGECSLQVLLHRATTASEPGQGTVCKRATLNFLVWQRARNDDSNKRLQPYLCRTHCPPQAGRGQPQLTTGPTPHIREKDQTRPFSKRWTATRPNKKTGKGGYHGVGGEGGGVQQPCIIVWR